MTALIALTIGLAQARVIDSPFDMVWGATPATKIILLVLAAFSLISWVLIIWKWREFRELNDQADRFVYAMEGARGLHDLHGALGRLEESPFTRVFREGVSFFGDLRPGALDTAAKPGDGLSPTQLDTLWLVLEKNLSQERDDLGHGLSWLAIIGSVSPLLGLMGTVVGVMISFIGIMGEGSANIASVAPGIAEALTTTVTGLAVAIPAVIAYNLYASRLRLFTGELEGFASEFIGTLAREGRI
ncbi:MAG: MotA/TolQ/ExbB proton channel family protein [Gemmatimonadota bacterium]|nr:MotA/TolQ/ExbB proton channel family protein [Gemmatimonadota bacterium]